MSALFAKLPESNPAPRRRSPADLVASVALHGAAVTLAVVATLHAGETERPKPGPDTTLIYVRPRPTEPPPRERRDGTSSRSGGAPDRIPGPIAVSTPPIELTLPEGPTLTSGLPEPGTWATASPGTTGGGTGTPGGEGVAPGGVFEGAQVEVPAAMLPGNAPRYPDALREARVEGVVVVRFVVDSAGRVERGSIHVVSSTNPLFTAAVRSALPALRFTPASAGGRRVRQLVELPFEFTVER